MVARSSGGDRGQLLATGAVVIAITLIAVVALYNGAVSSGGASSRTATDAAASAEIHNKIIKEDMQELTGQIKKLSDDVDADLEANVTDYSEQYAKVHAANAPALVTVTVNTAPSNEMYIFIFGYDSPELSYSSKFYIRKP